MRIDRYDGGYPVYDSENGPMYLEMPEEGENESEALLDPYGGLYFAVGTSEDFICFDYCRLSDGRYHLGSVVNSETGSFIMGFSYVVVPAEEAVDAANEMIQDAIVWCMENFDNLGCLHIVGWNQDPHYFARCVEDGVKTGRGNGVATSAVSRFDENVLYDLVEMGLNEDIVSLIEIRERLMKDNEGLRKEIREVRGELQEMREGIATTATKKETERLEEGLY